MNWDDVDFGSAGKSSHETIGAAPALESNPSTPSTAPLQFTYIQEEPIKVPPANDKEKVTIENLFANHLQRKASPRERYQEMDNACTLFLSKIDWNNQEHLDAVERKLAELEEIATATKNVHSRISTEKRREYAKRGKSIWDKERREENLLNGSLLLTDPRSYKAEKENKEAKAKLSKIEKTIKSFLETGTYEDEDIIDMACSSGQYTPDFIKGLITVWKRKLGIKEELPKVN